MVEPVDVLEDRGLCLTPGWPTLPPDEFRLQGFEERLDGGIEAPIFVKHRRELFPGDRGERRFRGCSCHLSYVCLYAKRLERGKFVWPRTQDGAAARLSGAQLAMLIEGLDWRQAIIHDQVLVPTLA